MNIYSTFLNFYQFFKSETIHTITADTITMVYTCGVFDASSPHLVVLAEFLSRVLVQVLKLRSFHFVPRYFKSHGRSKNVLRQYPNSLPIVNHPRPTPGTPGITQTQTQTDPKLETRVGEDCRCVSSQTVGSGVGLKDSMRSGGE